MIEPSADEVKTAEKLGVSLKFVDFPLIIARLVVLIDELRTRLDAVEKKRR